MCAQVLAALRPLLPRLYSISSSQLEHPRRVQVTVAVVRYRSLARERIGVTSTYLAERLQVCPCCLFQAQVPAVNTARCCEDQCSTSAGHASTQGSYR